MLFLRMSPMKNFNHSCKDEPTAKLEGSQSTLTSTPTASSVEGAPKTNFRSNNLLE